MASFEELPYEIIEALRSKNLLPFLELPETSCNQLAIVVYENQKYRPVIGEWGGIVGIHLVPGVDRRPFTNESGEKQLTIPYENIQSINGFKWESEWKVVVDETTDADGFEYAANWTLLHKGRGVKPRKSALTYVRRRRWKRVMVIDLNLMKRSLPYELRALVMVKPANPGQMITWASAYVELFVNGVIQGNGMVSPPSWTKEFTLPFAYIDKTKEITVVFSRTGIVRSVVQKTSTHVLLGNIVQTNNPRTVIFEDKNVIGTVFWTVAENHLFRIYNLEEALSEGQLKDMVLTEESLSQRLKQKIIMLSLGLGSNCNGLIKEITNILTEGQPIVSDLDLMEILDDVNSVQGKNEFEKVIALLKDAEKDGRLRAVSYPASVPWFTKYLNMHVYDLWHNYRPDRVKMREIINAYAYADAWYHHQPNFLVQQRIQYQQRWLQRINQSADAKATARNPVQYSVQVHMRGEIKEISLETDELTTYIGLLRLLSLVKHYQTGVYNKQTIIDLQYPMIVVVMGGIFGGIHAEASADFQEECFDLEYMDPPSNAGGSSMFDQILPIRIPFEYIEAITLSHDHFLAYDSLLEIKLLGATSFTSSGASNYKFRLEMNGLGGQTFYHDFTLNQDVESRQPPSGALNASFHIFASSEQLKVKPTDPGTLDAHHDRNKSEPSAMDDTAAASASASAAALVANGIPPGTAPPTAHVSLSARMGTIVPQSIHSSPKKSLSKRDSFFSLTSSSSSSSSSNANDASAVAAAATSATVQLPPVYLASNRDYTSLGHTNIALDIGMNQEKEMQIRLEKKRFAIHFALSQLQLADEEAIGTRDVYAIIYLADMYGQPFALSQGESNAPSSPKPTRQTSGSGSGSGSGGSQSSRKAVSMYDVQCLKRSARVNQSGHFTWEASERLTLDSHYYPVIENAAYFLVEIVAASDAASGSGAPMDRVLGEALIPIVYEELVDQEGDVLDVGQPTAHAIRLSEPVAMEFHQELVGDLIAATGYCLLQDPAASSSGTNTGTTSTMAAMGRASSRARARGNVVKLLASLKSIHPVDCAWPAHFLVNGKNAMDSTCCHVEILQEGLIIHVDNPSATPTVGMSPFLAPSNHQSSKVSSSSSSSTTTSSFAWTLLQDCMERKSMSSDTIEVLIAYDHIYMEDVCALSNHTLYLAFKVRRKLIAAQTQKIGYREIRLELIVGPCLAEEMAAVICNRIAMFPMRSFLCQHIASVDRSQEEAFTRLVKMFQEGIYETISLIEHASSPSRRKAAAGGGGKGRGRRRGKGDNDNGGGGADGNKNGDGDGADADNFDDKRDNGDDDSDDDDGDSDEDSIDMINRLTAGDGSDVDEDEPGSHRLVARAERAALVASWKELFPLHGDSSSLKLLYLKMATLKLYLWYLIEQSPVEFSAERHYLESSWMLFEETEELSLDTLIYRINEVMRNLEQDVRRQVLRACRKNTGDISSGLTKIIYQKYLQVITMLHEAIDHTVKAPSLFAAAASAGGAGSSSFSDPSSQQAATRRGSSFSVGGNGASVTMTTSSSVGGLSRSTSRMDNNDFDDVFRGSQSHALSRTSTFGVGATAANTAAETMYVAVNPQKKRDLIKFVIVNDDIFENFLNSILRSHRYTFSKRPLLSLCLEFEDLIDEFGKILDENILMWNTRTLRHFMSSRDEQHVVVGNQTMHAGSYHGSNGHGGGAGTSSASGTTTGGGSGGSGSGGGGDGAPLVLPWDITTLYDKAKAKELFISSIPETIQIQLNVEIGLKKVTPNAKFMSQQSMESLRRIDKMNIKIAQAIARSYVALASEYEKVMCTVLTQYAPWLLTVGANQEKDDLMCFVASIVNDCDRIAGTHIPQSVELFTQEYGFDPDQPHRPTSTSDGGGGGGRNSWWTRPRPGALGLLDEGGEMGGERSGAAGAAAAAGGGGGQGGADGAHSNNISFATCLKAISAISRAALNELTNQAIFSSDVREYFLTGIDNRRVVTSASSGKASSSAPNNSNSNSNSRWKRSGGSKKTDGNVTAAAAAKNGGSTAASNAGAADGRGGATAVRGGGQQGVDGTDAALTGGAAGGAAEDDAAVEHTPLDIFLATMTAFLVFASRHLNPNDTERLFYLCCKKIMIRYLLVIRDYHSREMSKRSSFWGRGSTSAGGSGGGGSGGGGGSNNAKKQQGKKSRSSLSGLDNTNDDGDGDEIVSISTLDRPIEPSFDRASMSTTATTNTTTGDDATTPSEAAFTARGSLLAPHANSHNISKNPDVQKLKRDIREISKFYSRMKQRLVPQWDESIRTKTEQAMSYNQQRKQQRRQQMHLDEDGGVGGGGGGGGQDDDGDIVVPHHDHSDGEDDGGGPNGNSSGSMTPPRNSVVDVDADRERRHQRQKWAQTGGGGGGGGGGSDDLTMTPTRGGAMTIEENPFDKTLLELLKKLSGCLMSTVLHDWTGPEIVDTFLSLNFGMEPPKYVADVNKYDAALEKFFRHDAAFAHFIPLLNIMQDESSLREEYLDMYGERASAAAGARMSVATTATGGGRATRTSFSRLSLAPSTAGGGGAAHEGLLSAYTPLYVVQLHNLACYKVKKFSTLFMKIYFNGKVVTTSLRANSMATPQWEDVVAFPPIPLSQCKEIKVEIYGFRLRALKMRRQIYVGSLTISVVDVLRSEIAHQQQSLALQQQQQQQQPHFGLSGWPVKSPSDSFTSPPNKRGSDASRLSISSLHRGLQAMSSGQGNNGGGCVHTAWYTVLTKAGLLSSLAGGGGGGSGGTSAANSSKAKAATTSRKSILGGKTTSAAAAAASAAAAAAAATAATSSSYVAALSSRGPRDDVDVPQMRLTLTVKPYHPAAEK